MIDRMDRVSKTIKREISLILQERVSNPRVRHVTITRVEVSRDLRSAKVFCLLPEGDDEKKSIMNGLSSASGFIRSELAHHLEIKYTPKLTFLEDSQKDRKESIDSLFEQIEQEHIEKRRQNAEGLVMDNENMKKVIDAFKARDNFLIAAHVNPEGDSIGSQLAVSYILRKLGKTSFMVNQDDIPDNLKFLSGTDEMYKAIPDGFTPETFVVVDCPVKERTGNTFHQLTGEEFVINIDHHISNEYFGNVNWVEPELSSVGEMLFHIIKEMDLEMDPDAAIAIYCSIVTDTGMFNYDNTSSITHQIVGELISKGADPKTIYSQIFENKDISQIRMLGKALTTLTVEAAGALAYMSITKKMYDEEGVDSVPTDEFINYPRSIKGVEVAVFFKESVDAKNKVNVSFRSTGKYDVNVIASHFGGGGHPKASGCVLNCGLQEAMERVLEEVKSELERG